MSAIIIRAPAACPVTGVWKSNRRRTAGCRSRPRAIISPGRRSRRRCRRSPTCPSIRPPIIYAPQDRPAAGRHRISTLRKPSQRKTPTGESNASFDYRIGRGSRRDGRCARDGVRLQPACWQPPVYVAPVAAYGYSGCNPCGGWVRERLPDPEQQYYYVNQGPTYTGPGNFAPSGSIAKARVSGYGYGYNRPHYGYRAHRYGHAASAAALRLPPLRSAAYAVAAARAAPLLLIQTISSESFSARSLPASGRSFISSGRAGSRRYRAPAPRRSRRSGS